MKSFCASLSVTYNHLVRFYYYTDQCYQYKYITYEIHLTFISGSPDASQRPQGVAAS